MLPLFRALEMKVHLFCTQFLDLVVVVVVVVRAAPYIPEMSVPGVGYSFKPKGLAFVTPLYPV